MIFVVVVVKKNCFRVVTFSVGLLKKVIFWFKGDYTPPPQKRKEREEKRERKRRP